MHEENEVRLEEGGVGGAAERLQNGEVLAQHLQLALPKQKADAGRWMRVIKAIGERTVMIAGVCDQRAQGASELQQKQWADAKKHITSTLKIFDEIEIELRASEHALSELARQENYKLERTPSIAGASRSASAAVDSLDKMVSTLQAITLRQRLLATKQKEDALKAPSNSDEPWQHWKARLDMALSNSAPLEANMESLRRGAQQIQLDDDDDENDDENDGGGGGDKKSQRGIFGDNSDSEDSDSGDHAASASGRFKTVQDLLSMVCPITGKTPVQIMQSIACEHTYEREAIVSYIRRKTATSRTSAVACPVAGCSASISLETLQRQAGLEYKLREAQRVQAEAASKAPSEVYETLM